MIDLVSKKKGTRSFPEGKDRIVAIRVRETGQEITYNVLNRLVDLRRRHWETIGTSRKPIIIALDNPLLSVVDILAAFSSERDIYFVDPENTLQMKTAIRETGENAECITDSSSEAWWLKTPENDLTAEQGANTTRQAQGLSLNANYQGKVFFLTSGSTGLSKPVRLSKSIVIDHAHRISDRFDFKQKRHLCVLPFHHTNGLVISLLAPLLSGAEIVVGQNSGLRALFGIWRDIKTYKITFVDLVPTLAMYLHKLSRTENKFPDLTMLIGGAPIPNEVILELKSMFAGEIYQEYGLSECVCIAACEFPGTTKLGSVGRPLEGFRLEVRQDDGQPCSPGTVGNIHILSGDLFDGYGSEEGNDHVGPLDTGDLGYFDDDGLLYVKGRKDFVILKGGACMLPEDIEGVAIRIPNVQLCAAVAIPEPTLGEDFALIVSYPEDNRPTREAIKQFLIERGGKLWSPKIIIFHQEIPLTGSGKVKRAELKDIVENYKPEE